MRALLLPMLAALPVSCAAPPRPTPQPVPSVMLEAGQQPRPASQTTEILNTLERLRAGGGRQGTAVMPGVTANTLERLRAAQPQNISAQLTEDQRLAIGAHVQQCWELPESDRPADPLAIGIEAVFDETGTVRIASVADADRATLSDPRVRAFAERALYTFRNPSCATLPLPRTELGKVGKLTFRFRP